MEILILRIVIAVLAVEFVVYMIVSKYRARKSIINKRRTRSPITKKYNMIVYNIKRLGEFILIFIIKLIEILILIAIFIIKYVIIAIIIVTIAIFMLLLSILLLHGIGILVAAVARIFGIM